MPPTLLTVSEAAARSGFAPSALRFYEDRGLLAAERTPGGQRRYPRSVLRRLAFVRAATNVGLSLEEIGAELALLPGLFGLLGWWLDGLLGTEPFLLIAFLIFSFAGMLVRAWIGYDRDMREQEAGLYTRLARRTPPDGAA